MISVLVVIPFYKPAYVYGGPTRSVPALCEALRRAGVEVTVFTTNANGPANLDPHLYKAQVVDELGRACAQKMGQYDLVYIVSTWGYPHLPACKHARIAGVPYIISPRKAFMRIVWRGKFLKKAAYHLLFERRAIKAACALHYTTESEARESAWLGVGRNFAVIPNPVDVWEMESLPERGIFRQCHGVGEQEQIILYMGRVDPDKGIHLVVHALSGVIKRHKNARFVIAGPDENAHVSFLKALANDLGVADRLIFTGMISGADRLAALRDADVFVLTSPAENFAMSVVESMAAGLPVLVSDGVGVAPEVAKSGAGMVVPLDHRAIGSALDKLLGNRELRQQMGKAGQLLARSAYAPDAVARLW
jgi:glycosyltransferase involved in cell wall biosynthesis